MMTSLHDLLGSWADAERDTDAHTTNELLTDDFVGIGPVGFQLDKAAWIQRLTDGSLRYDDLILEEVSISEYSESAVARTRLSAHGTARGNPLPTTRTSFCIVRIDGAWRIAGIHHSFIAGAPGSPIPAPGRS